MVDFEKPSSDEIILGYIYINIEKEHYEFLLTTKKIHYYYVKDTLFGTKESRHSYYSNVFVNSGQITFYNEKLPHYVYDVAVTSIIYKLCKELASCAKNNTSTYWVDTILSKM